MYQNSDQIRQSKAQKDYIAQGEKSYKQECRYRNYINIQIYSFNVTTTNR